MMWLEALMSSMLVAFAILLLLAAPSQPPPMLGQASLIQLHDRAALLAEFGADAGPPPLAGKTLDDNALASLAFPAAEPFCYRWVWLEASQPSSFQPDDSAFTYAPSSCNQGSFRNSSFMRRIERGVWRQGGLKFLRVEQAPAQ